MYWGPSTRDKIQRRGGNDVVLRASVVRANGQEPVLAVVDQLIVLDRHIFSSNKCNGLAIEIMNFEARHLNTLNIFSRLAYLPVLQFTSVICKLEAGAVDADTCVGCCVVAEWRFEVLGETGAEVIGIATLGWVKDCAFADELDVRGCDLELFVVGASLDENLGAGFG